MANAEVTSVAVLGAGTAGLLSALTLKRAFRHLDVRVIASRDLGVIGVGEGTTALFPEHLFDFLRLDPAVFHAEAQPTWKLGLRLLDWGRRDSFFYAFAPQFDARSRLLPRAHGHYAWHDYRPANLAAALANRGKVFPRHSDGSPDFQRWHAFHVENQRLVTYLAARCGEAGVTMVEGRAVEARRSSAGIDSLTLESGEAIRADLFIDASGFRSELLGQALEEPFLDFSSGLFCDRAAIGGWPRQAEAILPYTSAQTYHAGWCWQIEHEGFINKGYVYSSRHISDDEACREFLSRNPLVQGAPRVVKFRAGRYRRSWVQNVISVGNSAGFVEPLEATAIALIIFSLRVLVEILRDSTGEPTPTLKDFFNTQHGDVWDETRDFLALHYRYNDRLQTPFWETCRRDTSVGELSEYIRFWEENGPSLLGRHFLRNPANIFGLEGHLALLIGMGVPWRTPKRPSPAEMDIWRQACAMLDQQSQNGLSVNECLAAIRAPDWKWRERNHTPGGALDNLSFVVR